MLETETKAPRLSNNLTGMQGVYLVAAELSRRGFIVSPTSQGAYGADLLVADRLCRQSWTVQVKTTGRPASWCLVSKNAKETASDSHIYVFVTLRGEKLPEFMVVSSKVVAKHARPSGKSGKMMAFDREHGNSSEGWNLFPKQP